MRFIKNCVIKLMKLITGVPFFMSTAFSFFQQTVLALLGSQDFRNGLVNLFNVIQQYMPVTAITFDSYIEEESSLAVQYIVTPAGFFDVHLQMRLTDEDMDTYARWNRALSVRRCFIMTSRTILC